VKEQLINSIKDHCVGLSKLGVASQDDIAEVMSRISNGQSGKRQLLTKKQVADLAKVHPRTVDRWAEQKILTKKVVGINSARFDSDEIEKFLFGKRS